VQSLTIGNESLEIKPPSPERFVLTFIPSHTPGLRGCFDAHSRLWAASSKLLTVLISGNITSDIFLEQDVAKDLNKLGWDHESLFNAYKGCVNLIYEWWNED